MEEEEAGGSDLVARVLPPLERVASRSHPRKHCRALPGIAQAENLSRLVQIALARFHCPRALIEADESSGSLGQRAPCPLLFHFLGISDRPPDVAAAPRQPQGCAHLELFRHLRAELFNLARAYNCPPVAEGGASDRSVMEMKEFAGQDGQDASPVPQRACAGPWFV
eukprot:766238-Hanusia_phi.AAC.3